MRPQSIVSISLIWLSQLSSHSRNQISCWLSQLSNHSYGPCKTLALKLLRESFVSSLKALSSCSPTPPPCIPYPEDVFEPDLHPVATASASFVRSTSCRDRCRHCAPAEGQACSSSCRRVSNHSGIYLERVTASGQQTTPAPCRF